MITDNALLLAAGDIVPNGGATLPALGATSVTLATDLGTDHTWGTVLSSPGSSHIEMNISVTTSFTAAVTAGLTLDLVSYPIALSKLTNATGTGKRQRIEAVVTATGSVASFTVVGHNMPLGTPVYLSAHATSGGPVVNTIYYVVPTGADTFAVATTLANAIAGTVVAVTGGPGTATVEFLPFVHASTGLILAPFLQAGNQFCITVNPFGTGPTGKMVLATGQTYPQQLGSGPGAALVPGRFLALRFTPTGTVSTGAISAQLAVNAQNSRRYVPSGFVAL